MDNYIVINGKKAELTEEQLEKLGIKVEKKRNNPFDTEPQKISVYSVGTTGVEYRGTAFNPLSSSMVELTAELLVEKANSFNDYEFANQVYLHELLNRKLLKYAWDNEAEDGKWNASNFHYFIIFNTLEKYFDVGRRGTCKAENVVYFSSKKVAEKAIEDVVKPFMEEHKDFEW